jgi:putative flippase GtrA
MTNSFLWNKFWTFSQQESAKFKEELPRFLMVTLSGAAINIGIASLVVNIIGAPTGFSPKVWANLGAIVATLIGFLWNFLGYKFFAFRA